MQIIFMIHIVYAVSLLASCDECDMLFHTQAPRIDLSLLSKLAVMYEIGVVRASYRRHIV